MKQWWLVMALLLSVGINIGILMGRAWPASQAPDAEDGAGDTIDFVDRQPQVPPDRRGPRGDFQPRIVERMANGLELSGEKRQRFIERQTAFFEQTLAARIRFGRLQNQLRTELLSGDPDRQGVDALLEDIAAAHVDMERAFVDNLLDTREILDDEQLRRFLHFLHRLRRSGDEARRQLQEQFQQRPGFGGPGFGGAGPGGQDPPGRQRRPPWRQRRPPDPPPADPPPPPSNP